MLKYVFQALDVLLGYVGCYSTKKKYTLLFYILSSVCSVLTFVVIKKWSAILPVAVTAARYFVFMFKDKFKTKMPLYIFLTLHVAVLFLTAGAISNVLDLIPAIMVLIGCVVFWALDGSKFKGSIVLINIVWIVYYLYCGLYLVAAAVLVQTALTSIAYIKLKRQNRVEQGSSEC